ESRLFGLNPTAFHVTDLLLHTANAILLFLVLQSMSGAALSSAFVAAVFALHPLHVESVAWIAERKDVLSSLFWMLTLWAYARYAEQPGPGRYVGVVAAFALGLLAKPMLVTLPFVLLLLDYWPLGRFALVSSEWSVVSGKLQKESGGKLPAPLTTHHSPPATTFWLFLL